MFKIEKTLGLSTPNMEYLFMTDDEASYRGAAYVLSSGRLTLASGTTQPDFICLADIDAGTDVEVPVVRIRETDIFSTTSTATVAATLVGEKVTLHTDGKTVTATTSSGVFEIVSTDGATTNSNVTGRFTV